jgi:hypothetical protein
LRPEAAANFYHGVGRAIWILVGSDLRHRNEMLEQVPERYRSHASSGYGMGIAFTKVDDPQFVFAFTHSEAGPGIDPDDYLTGVAMGYTIRAQGDPEYFRSILSHASTQDRCHMSRMLEVGQRALSEAEHGGGDLHVNWRAEIRRQLAQNGAASAALAPCAQ